MPSVAVTRRRPVEDEDEAPIERDPFEKPWLLTSEVVTYLGYHGPNALRSVYKFISRHGVRTSRRFRTVLVEKRGIDIAIGAVPGPRARRRRG